MATRIPFEPDYAIHPGETLLETLEAKGMTQLELANRTGHAPKTINEIVQGKAPITAETALQFETVLGVPARFWNAAQANYDDTRARLARREKRADWVEWAKSFPLKQLVQLRWLPEDADPVDAVLAFFGVNSPSSWEVIWRSPKAAFRKSSVFEQEPEATACWLRQGERQAGNVQTQPHDRGKFEATLQEVRGLTRKSPAEFEPQLKTLCADAGVAVVFVPPVKGCRAYGATQWLTPSKALIQLSLRGKTEDLLWFTFFHEAGHILKHGHKDIFVEAKDPSTDPEILRKEEEADRFASDTLIPAARYASFIATPGFTAERILDFADELGICPGIIVGRMQREGLLRYTTHADLKRRYKFTTES